MLQNVWKPNFSDHLKLTVDTHRVFVQIWPVGTSIFAFSAGIWLLAGVRSLMYLNGREINLFKIDAILLHSD